MFAHHERHKRGWKTMLFLYFKHGWLMSLIGLVLILISWLMYFGPLHAPTESFLNNHPNWYITVNMLSSWFLMLGVAVIFIGYLGALVHYRHYRFILDENAFHLHRGLFFTRETTIPYQQISNVHIARPYHYRMFGIAQLDIVTAADKSLTHTETKTKEFLIPIIDAAVAYALSDQLVAYASKKRRGETIIEEDMDDEELEDAIDGANDIDSDEEIEGDSDNEVAEAIEILSVDEDAETTAVFINKNNTETKTKIDSNSNNTIDEILDIDDIRQLEEIEDEPSDKRI